MDRFAYNEERMVAGIRQYREEQRAAELPAKETKDREAVSLLQPRKRPRFAETVLRAAEVFEVDPRLLTDSCRVSSVVRARHSAMYLLRARGASYPLIGRYFGKHHTSVMHSVRRVDSLRATSPRFAARLLALQAALGDVPHLSSSTAVLHPEAA